MPATHTPTSPLRLGSPVRIPGRSAVTSLLLLALLVLPSGAAGQATPLPAGSIQGAITNTDDGSTAVDLTTVFSNGVRFGSQTYTQMHIGTNGYITFGHGNSSYSPLGIAGYTAGPIVAGQFDDLDPGKGGDVYYAQNGPGAYVVATWQGVAPFGTPTAYGDAGGGNTFQIVLRRIGAPGSTDFQIELRYVDMRWAQSSNNSAAPTAGWSAGDQATYSELPPSGTSHFLDVETGSNVGSPGVWRWDVIGGIVQSTPTVTVTAMPSSVTGASAVGGGTVSSDGGLPVTVRGVAWSTAPFPTTAADTAVSGSGTGSFTVSLTGLAPGTAYYVRAFATNALGTAYGPQRSFSTLSTIPPTVSTAAVSGVGPDAATAGGTVTSDGGGSVTVRGVAYGTEPNPTTAGSTVTAGSGTGPFTADLSALTPATTYHVRAFATNEAGTAYGTAVSFTTPKRPQSLSFPAVPAKTYGDAPFDPGAVATSGLAVTYASDDPTVATVSGTTVTLVGSGTVTLTASQAGNGEYEPAADVQRTISVAPRPVTGSFTVPAEKVYDDGTAIAVTGRSLSGVLAADFGSVELVGGSASFADKLVGSDKPVTLSGASLGGARASHYLLAGVATTTADIVPGPPHHLTLVGPASVAAGARSAPLTLTVRDAWENPSPVEAPTRFETTADQGTPLFLHAPSDLTVPAGATSVQFRYQNALVGTGTHRITVTRSAGDPFLGSPTVEHEIGVHTRTATQLTLDGPRSVVAGAGPVELTVTLRDGHGNPVPASGDLTVALEAPNATGVVIEPSTLMLEGGRTSAIFTVRAGAATSGAFRIVAARVAGAPLVGTESDHLDLEIEVRTPRRVWLDGPAEGVAGQPVPLTLTLLDAAGQPAPATVPTTLELVADGGAQATAVFAPASPVTIPVGATSVSFTVTDPVAGPHRVLARQVSGSELAGGDSDDHEITLAAGPLHTVTVEPLDDAAAGVPVGRPLPVRLVARDALGNTVTAFRGSAEVSADGPLSFGAGATPAFRAGVLERHEVVFSGAGSFRVSATARLAGVTATGRSEAVTVLPLAPEVRVVVESDDPTPAPGGEVVIRVVLVNDGEGSAQGLVVPPPLADQDRLVVLETTADAGTVDPSTGRWSLDALAPGGRATLTIRALVRVP